MDKKTAEVRRGLAATEVADKVFDALSYSCAARKLVRIAGSSRFGKTESVKTYCAMYPGRIRLVNVPWSNSDSDLVRAVAETLGIPVSFASRGFELRQKIEYVLQHGRLGLALDEAHLLIPMRFGRDTAPSRLNWVRTKIVDRRLPCILVCTPQAYDQQNARFQRATGYNMEQWAGRIALDVRLPEVLKSEDLLAVARVHFPDFGEPLLQIVAGAAQASENYLKAVEDIACRARWIAVERHHVSAVRTCDVMEAIRDVVPSLSDKLALAQAGGEQPEPCGTTARDSRRHGKASAEAARKQVGDFRPGARSRFSDLARKTVSTLEPVRA